MTAAPSTPAPFVDVCPVCGLVMRPYEPRFRPHDDPAWRHLHCSADEQRQAERGGEQ